MSRTFEVLSRVQQDQELFRVPPVSRTIPSRGEPADGKISSPDLDAFAREEILKLVQRLFLTSNNDHEGPRRVVFCGIDEADGSTLSCARLARSLAEQVPSQVCVADANARMPASSPLFDLTLPDSFTQPELGSTRKHLRRVTDNLWLSSSDSLGTKSRTPTQEQMRMWISDLRGEFTYVLINAPPVGLYGDAVLLGQMADGVVLVLEANSTRRVAALNAKQLLDAAKVRLLGIVLNNRTFPIPEKLYRWL
jgi:Mrp family chromosome partitioning ATPase